MEYIAVLFAALLHACWNAQLKTSPSRERSLIVNRAVAATIGLVFVLFLPPLAPQSWIFLGLASAIHLIYFFSILGAYKHGEFSQVYPIGRGLSPLLILLFTWLLGTETLHTHEILGICFVSLGIILFAGRLKRANHKALLFALLTACCITGYTLASGYGVRMAGSFIVYAAWLEFISGTLFVATATIKYRSTSKLTGLTWSNSRLDIVSGVLAIIGFSVALWAMTKIPFAAVSALRETSVVFAVLIGWLLFKEQQGFKRLVASAIVLVGVWVMLI